MKCKVVELKKDYPFLSENGCNPTLTVYVPELVQDYFKSEGRKGILICPGGGYEFCSDREAEPVALKFLNMGYNAYVLNYSCAPHRFPTQLNEVAAAFDYIIKNSEEFIQNKEKIGIIGFSAGGHLAAHYSNAYNIPEVRKNFRNSYKPTVSVLCYAVITSDSDYSHHGSFKSLIGSYPNGASDEKYSCDKLVTPDTPPAFIWHTAADACVPVENSLFYALALSKNKIPYELHIYPDGCHGLSTADEMTMHKKELADSGKVSHVHEWLRSYELWEKIFF